jgi:predicted nuclease with TOPRIM domain
VADISDDNMEMDFRNEKRLFKIEDRVIKHQAEQHHYYNNLNSKMDNLLQKMDAAWTENTALREAYHASREETAALKATVDTLTKKLDENIATTTLPSPGTATSSSAMEEMTIQLSHVQHDIQDVIDAVCNPPGKRKRRTSNPDNEPTMPTNRRLATNRQ